MMPWWLRPWRTIRDLRLGIHRQHELLMTSAQVNDKLKHEVRVLMRELRAARGASQVRAQEAPGLSNATQDRNSVVEFVIAGHDRLGLGKRVMASRDLTGTRLGLTGDLTSGSPKWQLGAVMGNMLIVDEPTYERALARVYEIWANWERNERLAIEHGAPGVTGPTLREPGWTDVGPTEGGVTLTTPESG